MNEGSKQGGRVLESSAAVTLTITEYVCVCVCVQPGGNITNGRRSARHTQIDSGVLLTWPRFRQITAWNM